MNDTQFGNRLRNARKAAGLSQPALGEAAGVSPQSISACELGKQLPTLGVAIDLAKALGVSLDYLCGIDTDSKPVGRLHSIADVVKYLSALASVFSCRCGSRELTTPEEWVSGPEDLTYTAAALYISNPALVGFIQNWNQMYTLYAAGTLPQGLFETWYEGELARLAEIPVPESDRQHVKFGFEPVGSEEV